VPAALLQAGLLDRFVTDYYANKLLTTLMGVLPGSWAARAQARTATDLVSAKVSSFPLFAASTKLSALLQTDPNARSRRWIRSGKRFAELCGRYVDGKQSHVYAFTSAAKELFERARLSGLRCILDHATAPRKNEMTLVADEQDRFPGWATGYVEDLHLDEYHARQLDEAMMADSVICNSSFAKRTLIDEGIDAAKIAVVPLGIRLVSYKPAITKIRGRLRVLYVGSEALRKGIPYLVQALETLSPRSIEVRFIGNLGLSAHGMDKVQRVGEVFGDVPRAHMTQHFEWADVLVLPSVSDTFGLVILEAMAHGVPVIASDHTGGPDVVRDHVDGFIVPVRDSGAIAARLDLLAGNSDLISGMSEQAASRVREYSLAAYRDRLVTAISSSSARCADLHDHAT
jgi:glycosyltransferase involved in cell wall biosynthesis